MMALDEFVLWVNADKPYKTVEGLHRRDQGRARHTFKMGGTGSKQEDQIITVALEKATGEKFTYIPYKGGGEVAVQLVGNHVNSTVNNPIEAVAQWRAGKLRPLCVFDSKKLDYHDKIAGDMSWNDIPTCKSQGLDVEYLMLRGYLHAAGRHAGPGRLLCRPVQEGARDARVEEADERRRLQPDLHDRRRSTPSGSRTKRSGMKA